eukprot:599063-Pelagomonas_calceolata.AAC.7
MEVCRTHDEMVITISSQYQCQPEGELAEEDDTHGRVHENRAGPEENMMVARIGQALPGSQHGLPH